jgi:hypothetical protein
VIFSVGWGTCNALAGAAQLVIFRAVLLPFGASGIQLECNGLKPSAYPNLFCINQISKGIFG